MRELIVYGLESSFARVLRCVEDITDDEARAMPHGLSPLLWQLGHLVTSDAGYLRRAGGRVEPPATYAGLFVTGTGGAAAYPPLGEVLTFTPYHRGYHIGKMTTLRALLGKVRLFG